jgi:hypothetical protein
LSQDNDKPHVSSSHTYLETHVFSDLRMCIRGQLVLYGKDHMSYKPKRGVRMTNPDTLLNGIDWVKIRSPESKSHRTRTPRLSWPKTLKGIFRWPKSERLVAENNLGLRTLFAYCPNPRKTLLPFGVPNENADIGCYSPSDLSEVVSSYSSESENDEWKRIHLASESERIPSENYPRLFICLDKGPGLGLGVLVRGPEDIRIEIDFCFRRSSNLRNQTM